MELPTRRYSQIKGLRRRGLMSRAAGPCEIAGCGWDRLGQLVYDHCHRHDYIRGVVCLTHNAWGGMARVDARVLPERGQEQCHAALLEHWAQCPECMAAGPWEAYQTEREWKRGQVIRAIVGFADEIAGRIPPRCDGPDVTPLREHLADFEASLRVRERIPSMALFDCPDASTWEVVSR